MIYKEVRYLSRMAKKKDTRKYVTISILRDALLQIDIFMKVNPSGSLYSSKSDFIHRAIEASLNKHIDSTVKRDLVEIRTWYLNKAVMLRKRGINSFEELLNRAIDFSKAVGSKS